MSRARVPLAVLAALAVLLTAATAWGATVRVTNENEDGPGSLSETILDAGYRDTIVVPPGTYPLSNGDTLLDQQNIIRGAGEGETTIIPTGGGGAVSAANVVDATIGPARNADDGEGSSIETQAQIVALIATLAIFLLILDLVRRRRLAERYALLWLSAGIVLLVLAVWTGALELIADLMGIQEPANAIFMLAFGVVFVLLLHFSVAISRLSEENKILAQESARLEQELRSERASATGRGSGAPGAERGQDEPPVGTQDRPQDG